MSLKKICTAINILRKSNATGIYNIASGKSFLLEDIAKYISNKFNKNCKFKKNKKTFLIGNINKLNRIGFSSKENFHKILDKIIKTNK